MFRFNLVSSKELDINSLSIALLNYIYSLKVKRDFFIRIDNLNNNNIIYENENIDILNKFSISSKNKIYTKNNIKSYENILFNLLKEEKAYICFCQNNINCECKNLNNKILKNLKEEKKSFIIKLKNRDLIIFQSPNIYNPNYTLAIDDFIYNVSDIIDNYNNQKNCEEEYLFLNELFFDNKTSYYYTPFIKKAPTIKFLLKDGFLPDAIINYILKSFFNIKKDIFYLPDIIDEINVKNIVNKESIEFNIDKLKEINKEHLKIIDSKKLSQIVGFADKDIGDLLKLFLNNEYSLNALEKRFKDIFSIKNCNNDKNLLLLSNLIQNAPFFENFNDFKNYLKNKIDLEDKKLEEYLSILLTNSSNTQNLDKIYKYIKNYLLEVSKCQ